MSDDSSFSPTRTPPPAYAPPRPERGTFITGSTMRHILVMSSSSGIGLMAVFLVDFADLYFLGLLGEIEVAAAIGYAGSVLFFTVALGVALSVAATALVSPALGAGKKPRARRRAVNALLFAVGRRACCRSCCGWPCRSSSAGWAQRIAPSISPLRILRIVLLATPLLAIGMTCAALLRSVGDAKRAMYVTLVGRDHQRTARSAVHLRARPRRGRRGDRLGAGARHHGGALACMASPGCTGCSRAKAEPASGPMRWRS